MPLDPKQIGAMIAQLRKNAGFTQKGLADRLFISDKAVSKWERGLSIPDIAYLGKLSVLLDVDIDVLLEGKNDISACEWKGFLFISPLHPDVSLTGFVHDKPLIYYLLSYYLLVGIGQVRISCSSEDETALRALLGNGERLGMSLSYSSAGHFSFSEAVRANASYLRDSKIMTVFNNSILYGANFTYLCKRAMLNGGRHTLLAAPVVECAAERYVMFDEDRRITTDNSVAAQYDYSYLPLLFSPGEMLLEDTGDMDNSRRLITHLTSKGRLYLEPANRGILSVQVTTPQDLREAAVLISILQKNSGVLIGCPEEISWRRGLIGDHQLASAAKASQNTAYGDYLLKLNVSTRGDECCKRRC